VKVKVRDKIVLEKREKSKDKNMEEVDIKS